MKILLSLTFVITTLTTALAQFQPSAPKDHILIIVTDGTNDGTNSNIVEQEEIPTAYDQVDGPIGMQAKSGRIGFSDPIRSLGMTDCIQVAAFLERPEYGLSGYMLIFSVNDAIGGKQGTFVGPDGTVYNGVYRLVRQKISADEPIPEGMTGYQVSGTFFLLGVS